MLQLGFKIAIQRLSIHLLFTTFWQGDANYRGSNRNALNFLLISRSALFSNAVLD